VPERMQMLVLHATLSTARQLQQQAVVEEDRARQGLTPAQTAAGMVLIAARSSGIGYQS